MVGPCHPRKLRKFMAELGRIAYLPLHTPHFFSSSITLALYRIHATTTSATMHPTPALLKSPGSLRRLALTTKQGPHNYYKGNRTGSMGSHTKNGGYIIDFKKVRTYVCPDLSMFRVRFLPSLIATYMPSLTSDAADTICPTRDRSKAWTSLDWRRLSKVLEGTRWKVVNSWVGQV